jgi:hypothetical protein
MAKIVGLVTGASSGFGRGSGLLALVEGPETENDRAPPSAGKQTGVSQQNPSGVDPARTRPPNL